MQTIRIATSQNIDIDYELAGLGERIVARLIDLGIFALVLFLCVAGGVSISSSQVAGIAAIIVYITLFAFYDLICEIAMNGQSVGKKVMKIKVISLDGAQPRLGQYMMRWLFRIADFGIGFGAIALVVAAMSEKVQRLGDMAAGTILVKTEARTKSKHIAFMPSADDYDPIFANVSQLSEQDINLVNEVINTYIKTGNSVVVYNMALRIKEHLGITAPPEMNDLRFLQTILKDYSHVIAQAESESL